MELELGNLTIEETSLPARTSGRNRKYADNPFRDHVNQSYHTGTGRSVTVPKKQVGEVVYLIRQAAADLGLGVRIVHMGAKGDTVLSKEDLDKASDSRMIRVAFQGQEKRKYEKKESKNDNAEVQVQ